MTSGRAAGAFEAEAAAAASRFEARLRERWVLDRDRDRVEDLTREVRPVCAALVEGLRAADAIVPDAQELREARTLASLLGRRAGRLGVTPSAMLGIVPSLIEAVAPDGEAAPIADSLAQVFAEGYVAAREELLAEIHLRALADAVASVELAPGCWAVFPGGAQDPAQLARILDELGRRLLDGDAKACVVHAAGLDQPSPELAAQLFAVDETCKMLGVACIVSGASDELLAAAAEREVVLDDVAFEPDFPAALTAALDACGIELRHRGGLGGVLRRLVRRD